ncbi:Plasmid pRiA4b ORF-3-like protein [Clostridium sartagoforme AAU1]|uniref:Plasmid pRiA4b ORF-3-like protein n=1 Tax=Clostridium sartagoforme AAU1 TaxID=1202534 RepID=R9CCK9_9CLOT|nr:plasmid pRiA4b ORF-3 family protein [Clostridium sartagoforme]EOR24941.1 Plasmid pRiA4b ORF-3-like protein [Clostridium sartagoforme AAU1]
MKAYKTKIELIDSIPLIYRKVIVPSGITFEMLHYIIQFSMGWQNIYLYDFNIKEENLRITSDKKTISEYEFYSKLKLNNRNDPYGFIKDMLKIKYMHSKEVYIDDYLNKENKIEYIYDFGDYWKHNITLEEVIEDYIYDYPKCIEAEGNCPPEDIGGIEGYTEFLKIINDKTHPEYENMLSLVSKQNYQEVFDCESANLFMRKYYEKDK